jgi:hypothetical protein
MFEERLSRAFMYSFVSFCSEYMRRGQSLIVDTFHDMFNFLVFPLCVIFIIFTLWFVVSFCLEASCLSERPSRYHAGLNSDTRFFVIASACGFV